MAILKLVPPFLEGVSVASMNCFDMLNEIVRLALQSKTPPERGYFV